MGERLWQTVRRLEPLKPRFVSVTYGAGGSTRERTQSAIARILGESTLTPAAHLTCIGATRAEVDDVVSQFAVMGVRDFVALRGDPAEGVGARYRPHPDGYSNGAELVAALRRAGDFEISVSAYPEKHPESPDFATDIDMLKRKVDNGATRAITQFFFDNDLYERYVERVRRAGIYIPIVPGILPIHNLGPGDELRGALRCACAAMAGRALRRARERPRHPCHGVGLGRLGAGARPGRARRRASSISTR